MSGVSVGEFWMEKEVGALVGKCLATLDKINLRWCE